MAVSLFVTGGSGYLGKRFLEMITPSNYDRIYCLDRGRISPVWPNQEIVTGDLTEPHRYRDALRRCETVVHMAAVTGKHPKDEYFRTNAGGTAALLGAAAGTGVRNVLYVSTIAVKFAGLDRYPYAASKAEAEQLVSRSGLAYRIVRPAMILGRDAPVLASLARLAAAPVVPVFGDGQTPVQPVFVDDVVTEMLSILEHRAFDRRTTEIGGPEVLSMEDLLLRIRSVKGGGAARVMHIPVRPLLPVLQLLEKFALPLLPFTAGQLSSFLSPGTAEAAEETFSHRRSVNQML